MDTIPGTPASKEPKLSSHQEWPAPAAKVQAVEEYIGEPEFGPEATHQMPIKAVLLFGGTGGAGTTTVVKQLNALGLKSFEPECRCKITALLQDQSPDLPQTKVVVVPATAYGAEAASKITAQYPINMVVAIQTSPLSMPWGAKLKFRAISGRSEVMVLPHVWGLKKNKRNKTTKKYNTALKKLSDQLFKHLQNERS